MVIQWVHDVVNLYNKAEFMSVCVPQQWPYLWTNFETKGIYGLPMTQAGMTRKIQNFKISKIKKKNIYILKNSPP